MPPITEDTTLIADALAYVGRVYRELSEENGAPTVGTQNQAVDFILGDPELARAVALWGEQQRTGEASTAPPQRLPRDALYERVSAYLCRIMEKPVFERPQRP